MLSLSKLSFFALLILGIGLFFYFTMRSEIEIPMKDRATTVKGILSLFPTSPKDIKTLTERYMDSASEKLDQIMQIPKDQWSFNTIALALDRVGVISDIAIFVNVISVVKMLHPDDEMRKAAHEAVLAIKRFYVEKMSDNKKLYDVFKGYVLEISDKEDLNEVQRYFLTETLKDFERSGLGLPDDERKYVVELKKELAELTSNFDKNIAEDASTISVSREGLSGVADDFIDALKKTGDGLFILGVDYPTYMTVMRNCSVEDTRKRLYRIFTNRAYPVNDTLLKKIIEKRDLLAHALGFGSYAYLDLDNQMVKTPERAIQFLYDLLDKAFDKKQVEIDRLVGELPVSVTLIDDEKIKPWDFAFLKEQYKKKYLAVDEEKVAEYFPMEKTVEGLLNIYQQFFDLSFKKVPVKGLWHDDVKMVQVYRKGDETLLGTLLFDLYPRKNKFSHAAHATIIPAVKDVDGANIPDVSVIIANFPKSTKTKPSLLKRSDVSTFFHEFGHAMHALLGSTSLASHSGLRVKRDFVEMPSQMLEEWLWDKDILHNVSSHYQTGEPLPDDLLDSIIALKKFTSGLAVHGQGQIALLALEYFAPGSQKDPYAIIVDLFKRMDPRFFFDPENHFYAAFGHLTGYGAKYYGYLWSKVFSLDLFAQIKKEGLLNPEVGRRYVDAVIGHGGSKDPRVLLVDFLGREPRMDAFIKDLGL